MVENGEELGLHGWRILPISMLRNVPPTVRRSLKIKRICTCGQLMLAAGNARARAALLETTGINKDVLLRLVQRADMARVRGIGTVFGLMLEKLGIADIEQLARQTPAELSAALCAYNLEERLARRSPALNEVVEWVEAAQNLPIIVTYAKANRPTPSSSQLSILSSQADF